MGGLNKQDMDALIQDFLLHLKEKSLLGLALKREFLKVEVYQDFKNQRLLHRKKVSCFSTVLHYMKKRQFAIHGSNDMVILTSSNAPTKIRQNPMKFGNGRRTNRSMMHKIKRFLIQEQEMNKILFDVKVNCLPPSTELAFGIYQLSIQGHKSCVMKVAISNNSVSDVNLTKAVFLSKGKDFFFSSNISQSVPIKIIVGCEFEIAIGCRNHWQNVGTCTTEMMLQFQLCQESDEQKLCNIVRCIRFEKTNYIVDELKPVEPFHARRKQFRRQFGNAVPGIRPPIVTKDNLEKDLKLDGYPLPSNVKQAIACDAFGKKEKSRSGFKNMRKLLESSLEMSSYQEKFHLLLNMEELQSNMEMQQYDMTSVKMKKTSKLLYLKVPGLAEKRPSVLRGDQIFASMASTSGNGQGLQEYQGFLHVVERDQIGVGFSTRLLSIHNPSTEYNIRFTVNRLPVRLTHRAVSLKLPMELIFPEESEVLYSDIKISHGDLKNPVISKNPEQVKAVNQIVRGRTTSVPYVIFGPPGTGKTVTMVEAMHQIVKIYEGCHILVCAPSNSSCDHLTTLLLEHVRPSNLLRMHAASRIWNEVPSMVQKVSNHDGVDYYFPPKNDLYDYEIIVCTLVTAGRLASAKLPDDFFTHVFIDEAGQATEPETMVAVGGILAQGGQVVLAGDPKQLGPLLLSSVAEEYGLGISFLERLMNNSPLYQKDETQSYNKMYITKLLNNYRSRKEIIQIPSELFYDNELRICVNENKLCNVETFSPSGFPVIFEGVRGEDLRESTSPSFYNPQEISVVSSYVENLFTMGISGDQIGIITPYRKQVQKIRKVIGDCGVKVGSVEEFQGLEKQIILISTVRSDSQHLLFDTAHCLGFLSNPKRFNVAITRAKSLLVVIGNPHILSLDFHWRKILEHCYVNGTYKGVPFHLNQEDTNDDDALEKLLEELHIEEI